MQKIQLTDDLSFSQIIHGMWRLNDWQFTNAQLASFVNNAVAMGITTYDHADIYGNHTCEALWGEALGADTALRQQLQLVSKCGIKLKTDKFPERAIKTYDYSAAYIIQQVEASLRNLKTDYLDVLLLHRPSPLMDANEVASAFDQLHAAGKVLHFGVSNFLPLQTDHLQSYVNQPLVTNQIEISPDALEHFKNNNIHYLQGKRIKPMAWSPLSGGSLIKPKTVKDYRLHKEITLIANELGTDHLEHVIYKWLTMHPAGIMPIVGSGKLERLKLAVESSAYAMTSEQWFRIYVSSQGHDLA